MDNSPGRISDNTKIPYSKIRYQNSNKNLSTGKRFKKSQISFASKFSKDRVAVKDTFKRLKGSNRDTLSFNNTNDTSIPENRLKNGLLSARFTERLNNTQANNDSKLTIFI